MNQQNPLSVIKKLGFFGGLLGAGVVYLMTNMYIISDTEVGVRVKAGEIQPEVVETGFAFTMPFIEHIRKVSTVEKVREFNNLTLATKQDAAEPATGNVAISYTINGAMVPSILREFGTIGAFENARLLQPMFSLARTYAAGVSDTRELQTLRTQMGQELATKLDARHAGYTIQDVMVQTITPHKNIATRISRAAQRAEDDRIEQHNLQLAKTAAETAETKAKGQEAVRNAEARARAFEKTAQADAAAHAIRVQGEAERDAMIMVAEGNKALDASLTAPILEDKRIAVDMKRAENYTGAVPHTIIGDTDLRAYGLPFANK